MLNANEHITLSLQKCAALRAEAQERRAAHLARPQRHSWVLTWPRHWRLTLTWELVQPEVKGP